MVQRVAAEGLGDQLSELLGAVEERQERLVVERHGKPVAAVVPMADFERLEAQRDDAFLRLLGEMRAGARGIPTEEVLRDVDDAVAEVRAHRRRAHGR